MQRVVPEPLRMSETATNTRPLLPDAPLTSTEGIGETRPAGAAVIGQKNGIGSPPGKPSTLSLLRERMFTSVPQPLLDAQFEAAAHLSPSISLSPTFHQTTETSPFG